MNEYHLIVPAAVALAALAWRIWKTHHRLITVREHEIVLKYHKGKLAGVLPAGEHRLWGRGLEFTRLDGRWKECVIQGQEFLTADRVPVKVSGLVRYRIADAERHATAAADPGQTLYSAAQLALRDVIGGLGLEGALQRGGDLADKLRELVAPTAAVLGYELDAVLVRDLMIGGDLKRVYTQAVTAKQEALAGLEKARGEAAAIRVMANAARVFENHPALLQLRFLQTLENSGGYNHQLFMGPLDPLMSCLKKD